MKRWVYAGTFDPITNGHLDVIRRAAIHVDELVVGVVDSPNHKAKGLLSIDERVDLAKASTTDMEGVRVERFSGVLVEFAQSVGANGLVRGLRTVSDFEYELGICHINRMLDPTLETFYIFSDPQWSFCSSSYVRELHALHANVSAMVPPCVVAALDARADTTQ